MKTQSKIAATLSKYSDWCSIIRINGIGTLNSAIVGGRAVELINMAEALHERDMRRLLTRFMRRKTELRLYSSPVRRPAERRHRRSVSPSSAVC